MIVLLSTLISVFIVSIYLYFKWTYTYWKRHGFSCWITEFPYGSFGKEILYSINPGIQLKVVYDDVVKSNYKYIGTYLINVPRLLVVCPSLTKIMLQTDFTYFSDRGFYCNESDPLSQNLFSIGGEKWRSVRSKLSTAFTATKLKSMQPILIQCGEDLRNIIREKCVSKEHVDIKDIAMSYNINVIASCGFGKECNCFLSDTEFKRQGIKVFNFSSTYRALKVFIGILYPTFANRVGIKIFDKDSTTFFINLLKETIEYRKQYNIIRYDMIQTMMELGSTFDDAEIKHLAAQVFVFFVAGFETSTNALTFCLYEISMNLEIQEKLRKEIFLVLTKYDVLNYESLLEMKYMDQVISETLRKYPPLMYISRTCVKDYCIPNTNTVLPKGTPVDFSILGLHHNPNYYAEPEKFDPERFSKTSKHDSYVYLPFGGGPRKCIGMQLGLMNMKTALTMLLSKFAFTLNKSTVEPIECDPRSFTFAPKNKILLNAKVLNHDIMN
ncbi:hypothetical protein FQA39_LY15046 [Lamprigera yunnana]|nr:hypothetical protein FQA39_LY15046 [Lamprigera yunnana]